MSLLTLTSRVRRQRCAPAATTASPALPTRLRQRVLLSADLLAALLEMEGRDRPTLDDLEWADAVAARISVRQSARRAG
jgi:hypothetical protein